MEEIISKGMISKETKIADTKQYINNVLLIREFGEPEILANGQSANLWCYLDKVIIIKSENSIFSDPKLTIKIIPMKNIKTLQFKNTGSFECNIKIGVLETHFDKEKDLDIDNIITFASENNTKRAIDAYFYIAKKICKI